MIIFLLYFATALALLLHLLFWGVGLTLWITPERWRRFWPVFCAPTGLMLQSTAVWAGAHAGLPGTNAYGWWSELIPLVLLAAAVRRERAVVWDRARRFWGVGLAMLVCLVLIVWPLSKAAKSLTTSSLGSCDAADYAAGARVLQEFAQGDRSGFIGHTEVVSIRSVDNFFDFWLRLNHFTPSALIALNGSVFGLAPYQITGLLTAVLLMLTLPLVFWLARTLVRLRGRAALGVAMLYGLSPVTWYAVYHVAPGQLIAALAIALLTWCGVVLWRLGSGWRQGLALGGMLFVGYSLVLGAYNFVLPFCLVPVCVFAGGCALWRGTTDRLLRWLALMLAPLAVAGAVNAARVQGLVERFSLFQQYDFGWRIPMLLPEGWLGLVANERLESFGGMWRWALVAATAIMILAALVAGKRRRGTGAFLAISLTLPIMAGYFYLQWRGARLGTNASYDAYKLLAVFFPGMLAVFCGWLVFLSSPRRAVRCVALLFAGLVFGLNLHAAYRFGTRMMTGALTVDRELAAVQKLEAMPEIGSLNMRVGDFWARLWANSFLLHRPQYFLTHTYEGRLNTALKGEWDLNGGLIRVRVPEREGCVVLNPTYSAVKVRGPHYLRADFGEGWYPLEYLSRPVTHWRWSTGVATINVDNPQAHSLSVVVRLKTRGVVERDLDVFVRDAPAGTVHIGATLSPVALPRLAVPPGKSAVEIRCREAPGPAGPSDARTLGFAVYGVELDVQAEEKPAAGSL